MTPRAQSAQLFVLAGVAFLALGALAAALIVWLVKARLVRWEPRARHTTIALLAVLPVASAMALLFAASLPAIRALFAPELDHCGGHDDVHAHLCFTHFPSVNIHGGLLLLMVFLASYGMLRGVFSVASLTRAVRVVAALAKTGEWRSDLGITIVETTQPVCFTAGLLRPRVLFSRGLYAALAADERAVVLAHESAHVRRRDALVGACVRALAVVHVPWVGRWLVQELDVAAEQACDEAAVACVRDRLGVAAAIVAVERISQQGRVPAVDAFAVGFGARAVERRVKALLADPLPPRSLRPMAVTICGVVTGLLLLANELHHLTESVLSRIAH